MMVVNKERQYGRIDKAFCFELDAIYDAYQALERGIQARNFHLYCTTPGCGWKLNGGVKHRDDHPEHEIAWYVGDRIPEGKNRSHADGCKYGAEKRTSLGDGSGESEPPETIANPAPMFIPHELLDPFAVPTKKWPGKDPDPDVLKRMIEAATGNPVHSGTLEEVVDAERHLAKQFSDFLKRQKLNSKEPVPKGGKPDQRLRICGRDTDYNSGFVDLFKLKPLPTDPQFWNTNIAYCACVIDKVPNQDSEFLLYPAGRKSTISINTRAVTGSDVKAYIRPLLEAKARIHGRLKCFIWDLQPLLRQDEGNPTFRFNHLGDFMHIALREILPKT